ncbi:MAG: EF-P beta-lysylation protein EpmB, partial [Gammaproteobacteria bacterium]
DPLAEGRAMAAPGLLHKYRGRVLLTLTGACAIHCRYCFRRHFPYARSNPLGQWPGVLDYLARDPSIQEVILSGGDPLMFSDAKLERIIQDLEGIRHIRRLRLHTRLPVVIPQRVTEKLRRCLTQTRFQGIMVLHINHPNEIDDNLKEALGTLRGVCMLNQSVLLRGINDSRTTLKVLSEKLFEAGVLPYYLHLLDKVQGAAHFDVPEARARQLMEALSASLPGYLVPRLVKEEGGAPAKTPVGL